MNDLWKFLICCVPAALVAAALTTFDPLGWGNGMAFGVAWGAGSIFGEWKR